MRDERILKSRVVSTRGTRGATSADGRLNFREIFYMPLSAPSRYVMAKVRRHVLRALLRAWSTCEKSRAVRPLTEQTIRTMMRRPERIVRHAGEAVVGGGFIYLLVESGRDEEREKGELIEKGREI